MSDRYAACFEHLAREREGAFIPFWVLGDPTPAECGQVLATLTLGGADALELGIPYSDPIADGPVVQEAARRALAAGTGLARALELVAEVRARNPALPIGLLGYANPMLGRGLDRFYGAVREAGVDSVLVVDAPLDESAPFEAAARRAGIAPVLIVPPTASAAREAEIARRSRGYVYVATRPGVTGPDRGPGRDLAARVARLRDLGAAPAVAGFGISTPEQVRAAIEAGAAGAVSGSAVVRVGASVTGGAETARQLRRFVASMKAATRCCPTGSGHRD